MPSEVAYAHSATKTASIREIANRNHFDLVDNK